MTNVKLFWLLAVSLMFLPSWSSSQSQKGYSLEEIIDLYSQNNIALKIGKTGVDNALSRRKIAGTWENPSIRYTQEGIQMGTQAAPVAAREFQLVLEQTVPLSGRKGLQSKHAEQDIRIASQEYQEIYWTGLSYVKGLFYQIQSLSSTLDILENMKAKIEDLQAVVIENFERGEASGMDTARMAMILKDLDLEKHSAETALDVKRRELLTCLDLSQEPSQMALDGPYCYYVIKEAKGDLARSLIENNPRIQILAHRQQQHQISLSLEKRKNVPELTAAGGYKREHLYDTYAFAFSLDIPILNRHRGEIEIAKSHLRTNELERRRIAKTLLETFEEEHSKHYRTKGLIQLFASQYIGQADKLENAAVAAYKGGEVNVLTLVDALQSALDTRREFIGLILQNNITVFNIEKIIGREIDAEKTQ